MKRLIVALACLASTHVFAWGADGHSIIAEIAQRRLTPEARQEVERLLGPGVSLASYSSWGDDVRAIRPETFNWHFVSIPLKAQKYDAAAVCQPNAKSGDCIIAELNRERAMLTCPAGDTARRDALKFAVHFMGDMHQPFHVLHNDRGGNDIKVDVDIRNGKCPKCTPRRTQENLHQVWDSSLITATAWSWGAYVTRLEEGWLMSPEAKGAEQGSIEDWAMAANGIASQVWDWLPADKLIGDEYYTKALPLVDKQLALGGLRLARFLNETLPARLAREKCG